jgi:hypothetical protein
MYGTDPGGGGKGCSYGSNDGASRKCVKNGTAAIALSIRVQPGDSTARIASAAPGRAVRHVRRA